jgi:hypothetical protein
MAKLAFAVAFLAIALSTQADTIVNVSATTCSCSTSPISIDLQAQFDLQQASGNFFDAGISDFIGFSGPVEQVVSISGTLNGFAMTLAPPLQRAGSWRTTSACSPSSLALSILSSMSPIFYPQRFH